MTGTRDVMEGRLKLRWYARIVNRLGITSIVVGVLAVVIKAWATYWLGPAPVSPPVSPPAAPAVTSVSTVEDLLQASPISLTQWQVGSEARYNGEANRADVSRLPGS